MTVGTNTVINLGRAVIAALQPITGARAVGLVSVRAVAGKTVVMPRHTYWTPSVDGRRMTQLLFKTMEGPNDDGSWTITDAGVQIALMSNAGGIRHNVPSGTPFFPDIPDDDLIITGASAPVAVADFAEGADAPDYCGVKDISVFESFDGPAIHQDLSRSALQHFPGVLIAFQDMEPADGVAIAQTNQQAVNAATDIKFYKVGFTVSVIAQTAQGDATRRKEGLIIADTIQQLLNDKHMGDEGENLSNPGGLQIRGMSPQDPPQEFYQKFYIYTVLISCMTTIQRKDFRTFAPWLRAVLQIDKPQVPALPDQGTITVVSNNIIDMTPDRFDLAIDAHFTRATVGNLQVLQSNPGTDQALQQFAINARRVVNKDGGLFMEPTTTNAIGAASTDFGSWTTVSGASVSTNTETDPLGGVTADQITFPDDETAAVEFGPLTAAVGEPTVFQVWARSPGVPSGNKFKSTFRLSIVDGAATEFISGDFVVGPNWTLIRFAAEPAGGTATLRVQNRVNNGLGIAGNVLVWGGMFSDTERWGPQFTDGTAKAVDAMVFDPRSILPGGEANEITPLQALTGVWRLRWASPLAVPPDFIGTGTAATQRTLVSIGDGSAPDLFTMQLIGTPATGGAALTLTTRTGGVVLSLAGVEWIPGNLLTFTINAEGKLKIQGTSTHDGLHTFTRYDLDAVEADDFIVIGNVSDGSSSPTPGRYVSININV